MNKPEIKENLRNLIIGKTEIERYGIKKAATISEKKSKARKGKYLGKNNPRYKIYNNLTLLSPDGVLYTSVSGIKDFALEHNLSPNHFCELLLGKRKSHKGWRIK